MGNVNIHCYTGICKNIFEIQVKSEIIDDRASEVKIISHSLLVEEPTNEALLLKALELNDKQFCNSITGADKELCINIFEDNCDVYSSLNLETCEHFKDILKK